MPIESISNLIQNLSDQLFGQSQGSNISSKGNIKSEAANSIQDAYDFLTQIVWTDQDRAEEIARITRAALGPIGALVAMPNQS